MSKAIAFLKCGNDIYAGVYDGTSDILCEEFITLEEYYKLIDSDKSIYSRIYHNPDLKIPSDVNTEKCEIYSDYGRGFYWEGSFNKEYKVVVNGLDPYNLYSLSNYFCFENDAEEEEIEIKYGKPDWLSGLLDY